MSPADARKGGRTASVTPRRDLRRPPVPVIF